MSSSSLHARTSMVSDADEGNAFVGDGVVHGELENQEDVKRMSLSSFHLWALGISIVVGGQYIGWNEVLLSGFGSALIATVLISSGYVCLVLCIAELSSAIPFGGGSYGIARVTLGFFPGYIVAFMEASQNIIFVACTAVTFGKIVTAVTQLPHKYEPIYWVFFYVSSLVLQIGGGRTFWFMIVVMAIVSVGLLVIYVFGTIPDFEFDENALFQRDVEAHRWFRGGGVEFMRTMPLCCWFYLGVENINLACKDVPNPRVQVPRGYLSCIATLVVMSFAILFCCSSVPPGISQLMFAVDPLHNQFQTIFNATKAAANTVVLPSICAMCSGSMYCYGKQMKAMARSGLINPYFALPVNGYKMPVRTLIFGSLCSILITMTYYLSSHLKGKHLFMLAALCAFVAYAAQFASFIIFRYKFSTVKREYTGPLGLFGAVYGFCVFGMAFVGVAGFQSDYIALSLFVVLVVLVVAYYFYAAMDRQSFSEEEKQVMFRAYLIKSNEKRNSRLKKGKVAQGAMSSKTTHSASYDGATNGSPPKYRIVPPESSTSATVERMYSPDGSISNTTNTLTAQARGKGKARAGFVAPRSFSASSPSNSRRVRLMVDIGSTRIAMTGEVAPEELQDNDEVEVFDEAGFAVSEYEYQSARASHSILHSNSATTQPNSLKNERQGGEFTDIEHVKVPYDRYAFLYEI